MHWLKIVWPCKKDRNKNPIRLSNDNPILDTWSYFVNFDNGEQTKLTANMIAESLYSQCDPDSNQYVLLNEIVNHQCLSTAVKLTDQKINSLYRWQDLPEVRNHWLANVLSMEGWINTLGEPFNHTLLRLLNTPTSLALTMNQLSAGGSLTFRGRGTALLLLWENEVLVT